PRNLILYNLPVASNLRATGPARAEAALVKARRYQSQETGTGRAQPELMRIKYGPKYGAAPARSRPRALVQVHQGGIPIAHFSARRPRCARNRRRAQYRPG